MSKQLVTVKQTKQLECQRGQKNQITTRLKDAFGIRAKPRGIFGEYWLARQFENKCLGTALKVLFLNQEKMAVYKQPLVPLEEFS